MSEKKNYKIIIRAAESNDYYAHNTDQITYDNGWIRYKSNGVDFIVPKENIVMIEVTGD